MKLFYLSFILLLFTLFIPGDLFAGGTLLFEDSLNSSSIDIAFNEGLNYDVENQQLLYTKGDTSKKFPGWFSILPALIAIILALVFREVHIALVSGIFFGIFVVNGMQLSGIVSSFLSIPDSYIIRAVAWTDDGVLQTGHLSIIIFSVLIGGMVHVISSNGGMNGIVQKVSKLATSARRTQLATMLIGCIIFFDDYANTLVVGNTMRPLTDRFKISREKLAYIVDSTAAPIASVALVTTWIGYQITEIEKGVFAQNYITIPESAYGIFLGSLKYAYYPVLTLLFVALVVILQRDFGPMYTIEKEARSGKMLREKQFKEQKTSHWLNAAIPIITLVSVVVIGLFVTGFSNSIWEDNSYGILSKIRQIISNADSYTALIWASFLGAFVAILMSLINKIFDIKSAFEELLNGFKTMVPAVVILVLAWALAAVIEDLHTASYLADLIPTNFNARWLPFIFFIISAIISFSTGSSWNTMAVMYPISIPIVLGVSTLNGNNPDLASVMPILLNSVSVILAASVFGDHCSPISDTTILSSLSSHCDHISHVKTQIPYALAVGSISLLCGGVLFAIGVPWYLLYLIGIVMVVGVILIFGKKIESYEEEN